MQYRISWFCSPLIALSFILLIPDSEPAAADLLQKAKKKSSGQRIVDSVEILTAAAVVKSGKKQKEIAVSCLGNIAGKTKNKKDRLIFTSYAYLLRKAQKQGNKKKIGQLRKLKKAGNKACKAVNGGGSDVPNPVDDPLDPYKGPFQAEHVRLLYDHFAFGASQADVDHGVQNGLDAAIERLTTYYYTPELDARERDLRCDGMEGGSEVSGGKDCDPNNPNDVYFPGVRYGLYLRFMESPLPYFEKLFMVLHDRVAASAVVLSSCEKYALVSHIELLRQHAIDGDYFTLMQKMITDHLMLKWLDGANNRIGAPNENFAREFWELFTTGTTAADGQPVYSSADIEEAARAFTGWTIQTVTLSDENNTRVCYPAYIPALHDPGEKTIYTGTSHQTIVEDGNDVLEATFNNPSAAEDLADHLWKEYINPHPPRAAVLKLARMLQENNFNLHPVLKTLMQSRALYLGDSRRSLLKDPVDFIFGFLRSTGIPAKLYYLDSSLDKMGQQPTLPVTVFGWHPDQLAGEGYMIEARNALITILSNTTYLKEEGFSFHQFLSDGMEGIDAITRLESILNLQLNQAQRDHLDQFMNFDLKSDDSLERLQFDSHIDAENIWWRKTSYALYLLASTFRYRTK